MYQLDTLWQPLAAVMLTLFLLSVTSFLVRRLAVRGGRLVPRRRYVAPRPDPHSGRPGWPTPRATPTSPACFRPVLTKVLVTATLLTGLGYMTWRWQVVDLRYWWISVPLVLAETHLFIEIVMASITLWTLKPPKPAPPPLENATVDVFITTYNEPVELVRGTVRAAQEIRYPHQTYILDDGASPAMRQMAEEEGVGYICRTPDWDGKPRHAKAGNIANALNFTSGEFILLQDADQIPLPDIVHKMIGYFRDEKVALIQSPQWFYNAPPDDPLGSQQPIFYGPVMQGKDFFNSAFFCGSNGMLRREALLQFGVRQYAETLDERARKVLDEALPALREAREENRRADLPSPQLDQALMLLEESALQAREDLARGASMQDVTWRFQARATAICRELVESDLAELEDELHACDTPASISRAARQNLTDPRVVQQLLQARLTPLESTAALGRLLETMDVHRNDEAQPVLGFSTYSVTEDMATAYDLHQLGWKTVYHHEILARGLAPDDLPNALSQRLRWAQGAFQIALRRSPWKARNLSLSQRFIYFHSFLYYSTGLSILTVLLAPIAYVLLGWPAIRAHDSGMLVRFLPYIVAGQITFWFWTWGLAAWRSVQYGVAFFPVWIQAVSNAVREALGLTRLTFVVTSKDGPEDGDRIQWAPVRWQLVMLTLLTLSAVWGLGRVALGWDPDPAATVLNVAWAWIDVILLGVVIDAATFRPPTVQEPEPPRAASRQPARALARAK